MNIVFRLEAGPDTGMGHLMRCVALAESLRRNGAITQFLCQPRAQETLWRFMPAMPCETIPSGLTETEDAAQCRALLSGLPEKPDWLVVDHDGLGRVWESHMRPAARRIMAIDDIGRAHDCDLLLDANYAPEGDTKYPGKVPASCRLLLGPRYALLRGGFRNLPPRPVNRPSRIFVCFGGSDPHRMTEWTVKTLAGFLPESVQLDILAGYGYPQREALAALCKTEPNWRLHIDHPHPEALMAEAGFAIGAGGIMTWERCAAGLPAIVISIADNQRKICEALAAGGYIHYLGHYDTLDDAALRLAVTHLLDDGQARAGMADAGRALVNVNGAGDVAKTMLGLP